MAYIKVENRTKGDNPFFRTDFSFPDVGLVTTKPVLTIPTSVALSTPSIKYIPVQQRFRLGEGLPKTVTTAPFGSIAAIEQKRQAEIFGQEITGVTTARAGGMGLAPIGRVAIGDYIPVRSRIDVKIPFIEAGFTLPASAPNEILRDFIQTPEKIIKSAYYQGLTDIEKEAFKIKDENKIFQSPLYQKDYKELIDLGVSPVGAFILTGINAAVDASIFSDFIAKPIIKQIAKVPIKRAAVTKLTWEDLREITRGKVLSNEKMAAFNKASQDGIEWIKVLKKDGNTIKVVTGDKKTLGEWVGEQYEAIRANQAGFARFFNAQDAQFSDTIQNLTRQLKKTTNKNTRKTLKANIDKARKSQVLLRARSTGFLSSPRSNQGGFAKLPSRETQPTTIADDIASNLEDRAIKEFGLTDDSRSAGFITRNGRMIDSSGFKQGNVDARGNRIEGRTIDHREIALSAFDDVIDAGLGPVEALSKFMNEASNVRVDFNRDTINIDTIKPINSKQMEVIELISVGKEIVADISKTNSLVDVSGEFKNFNDFKKWHNNHFGLAAGIEPDEEGEIKFDPAKAIAGLAVGKIVKRGKGKKISKEIYKQNRTIKRSIKETIRLDTKTILKSISVGTDKYLGSISTRLANINPELKRGLRTFEFNIRNKTLKDVKAVKPLLDATKKMSKDDRLDFDLARKNGDKEVIDEIVKKYGIEKEINQVRVTLDALYERARDVGYSIGYLDNYSPRIIKDKAGFIDYFRGGENWSTINQAIKAKEQAIQRYLTEDEKVLLINTMIRGYQQGNIALSETGNMKTREIEVLNAELNQFYMDSNASLVKYIEASNEAIEARKFFGKGRIKEDIDINDSIGAYIMRLLEDGKITAEQEIIVSDILKARFNAVGTRGAISLYKNLSYIDTMGSVTSAITQIGDLAWPLYKAGVFRTAKNVIKASVGKSNIKRSDIGIENIAQEFEDPTKASRAVNKIFKLTGLEKIDKVGKETLINAIVEKYQGWAKKGDKRLNEILEPIFGKDIELVMADLKAGRMTEDVKLIAFNTLLDFQPVALSEMPQKYLTGGNGRIFYMLKTFTLKQFDIYRREVFQQISKKGTRLNGIKNLISLVSFFVIMNATADEIKDLILNRKTSLSDRVVDNILRAVGFSKYLTWKVRTEGLGSGLVRQILPPFKFIDSVSKDILRGIENGSEVIQSIPLGGKLYYWWFGKGAYKNKKRVKSNTNTRLEEFDMRIEKLQSKSRLQEFEDRIKKIENK